jgi:hypothetical protein
VETSAATSEHQLSCVDLRKVEHVVDDGQQRVAGLDDHICEGLLAWSQFRLGEKFGHAQYAVHGRADLVAHIGEEFGFRPISTLRTGERRSTCRKGLADDPFDGAQDREGDKHHECEKQPTTP